MQDIKVLLVAVLAEVDQLTAEFRDPETRPDRKEEIRGWLSQLYDELKKYEHQ